MDGFRYLDEGLWVGMAPMGVNRCGEVAVEGSEEGPNPILMEMAEDAVLNASQIVDLAVAHLSHFTSLGHDADWYPDGMRVTGDPEDRDREVIVELSTELDIYALWSVAIRTSNGKSWVYRFERRQQ